MLFSVRAMGKTGRSPIFELNFGDFDLTLPCSCLEAKSLGPKLDNSEPSAQESSRQAFTGSRKLPSRFHLFLVVRRNCYTRHYGGVFLFQQRRRAFRGTAVR